MNDSKNIIEIVKELQKLHKNSTSGLWKTIVPDPVTEQHIDKKARFPYDEHQKQHLAVMVQSSECENHAICDCSCNHTCVELLEQEDNASLICALHNAFPALSQALLLAVEALKRIQQEMLSDYDSNLRRKLTPIVAKTLSLLTSK